jgi:hypothetical protein
MTTDKPIPAYMLPVTQVLIGNAWYPFREGTLKIGPVNFKFEALDGSIVQGLSRNILATRRNPDPDVPVTNYW